MASPQVAGAASGAHAATSRPGRLQQDQVGARVNRRTPCTSPDRTAEVLTTRRGRRPASISRAQTVRSSSTSPTGLSFGLLKVGTSVTQTLNVTDAGGGAAPWTLTVESQSGSRRVHRCTERVNRGRRHAVDLVATAAANAAEGEATGFVVLTRGTEREACSVLGFQRRDGRGLPPSRSGPLRARGSIRATRAASRHSSRAIAIPTTRPGAQFPVDLGGPEQVFRFTLTRAGRQLRRRRPVTRSRRPGLAAARHRRRRGTAWIGNTGLPSDLPTRYSNYGLPEPVVGGCAPHAGFVYSLVFDTPSGARPGVFTFRFWMNDVASAESEAPHALGHADAAAAGGRERQRLRGRPRVDCDLDRRDPFRLPPQARRPHSPALTPVAWDASAALSVADYQETKNMEDVLSARRRIRGSTRRYFVVR